jgi:putative aldouronate transport system substrate-binding protein
MIYRSDWLETLGLAVPNTLDELYDVLRAFTRDDPDRDGVDNTIGMAWTGGYLGPFYNLAVMFGAPNRFGLKDGKLVPWFEYGEFFQAMEYCKRLYDEGIINRDFAALQTGDWPMLFSTNRAGWHIDVVDEMSRGSIRLRDNGFITFDAWTRGEHVGGMGPVADRNGEKHIMATPGHAGYVAISTAGAKSLQELHYYLDFLDKCNDELGQTIISWGAEGVNWIRNPDSTITTIPSVDIPNGWHITAGLNGFLTLDGAGLFKTPTAQEARYREVYRENLAFVVHDPTLPLAVMSQTWTARAQSLNQIVDDAVINFVMGNIDRAGFGREVARWYSQDGQKALGELQAAYDASR